MRKSVCFLLGLSFMSQLFFACKKDDEKVTPTPTIESQPGYFVVSLSGSANDRTATEVAIKQEFDLGPLLASDEVIFMVANGGDEPIFDVTLTSDNLPFDVSPKFIAEVPGKKKTTVYPLLNVGITHGVPLKGVGTAPKLPKGENKATITMRGKTLSGKDTVEVSGEFVVKIDAKVLDIKVLSGGIEAVRDESFTYGSLLVVEPTKTVVLVNSGNVPIKVDLYYNKTIYNSDNLPYTVDMSNSFEMQPNEEKDISNLCSPYWEGYINEEGLSVYYWGQTLIRAIPTVDYGVVINQNQLALATKATK